MGLVPWPLLVAKGLNHEATLKIPIPFSKFPFPLTTWDMRLGQRKWDIRKRPHDLIF